MADKWISEPLRPLETVTRPAFALPARTCDTHMHVFGPIGTYPGIPNAKYTKPNGDLDEYRAVAERLGIGRMVFVQASFYGTDNSCILDAMAQMGDRCRGVVFLPDDAPAAMLDAFQAKGVRGIRLDLFKTDADGLSMDDVRARIAAAARLAKQLGWHLEFYAPGRWVRDLLPHLAELDVAFSVNHMGYMTAEDGVTDGDFRRFADLLRGGRGWVKLTGTYRVSPDGGTERTDWMAQELIAAAPDRVVWGTDWPHIPHSGRDTGELLNRLAVWCPDEALRARILVDNPARLYGFE